MRDPVEPASIIRAYCTSDDADECGVEQCVVLSGSGSISGDVGTVCGSDVDGRVGNLEGDGASVVCISWCGLGVG